MAKFECLLCNEVSEEIEIDNYTTLQTKLSRFREINLRKSQDKQYWDDVYHCPKCMSKTLARNFLMKEEGAEEIEKTYKLWEVIKMLSENKEFKFTNKVKNKDAVLGVYDGYIQWCDGYELNLSVLELNIDWYLVKEELKPKTFEEIINSTGSILVKHEITERAKGYAVNCEVASMAAKISRFMEDDYLRFNDLMLVLGYMLSPKELKEVVKNGKWYVKEDK